MDQTSTHSAGLSLPWGLRLRVDMANDVRPKPARRSLMDQYLTVGSLTTVAPSALPLCEPQWVREKGKGSGDVSTGGTSIAGGDTKPSHPAGSPMTNPQRRCNEGSVLLLVLVAIQVRQAHKLMLTQLPVSQRVSLFSKFSRTDNNGQTGPRANRTVKHYRS